MKNHDSWPINSISFSKMITTRYNNNHDHGCNRDRDHGHRRRLHPQRSFKDET
jgi:hypothetical protein